MHDTGDRPLSLAQPGGHDRAVGKRRGERALPHAFQHMGEAILRGDQQRAVTEKSRGIVDLDDGGHGDGEVFADTLHVGLKLGRGRS